ILKIISSVSPSMEDLPGNVIADILTRLPVKTIIHCKCVCKKWREYVSESYFVNLHLSRSPAGVMIHHNCQPEDFTYQRVDEPGVLKWLEIEREGDDTHLHHDHVTSVDLNREPAFHNTSLLQVGSVNGLVCLWQYYNYHNNTYICNPITREYMILPRQRYYRQEKYATVVYGFGVGLRTKEYKVIRIFQTDLLPYLNSVWPRLIESEIYTLGTGQWRSLGHVPYWLTEFHGPFLNGCVHWTFRDQTFRDQYSHSPEGIYAFDFDNETFHLFPSPPFEEIHGNISCQKLGVLKGCLCQCDSSAIEFTIWVMKEYGIKKSWHKEVVIKQSISPGLDWLIHEPVTVLEGLEDGTILMLLCDNCLLVYSPQKKTIEKKEMFRIFFTGMAYRPSLLKLQTFDPERV
ncbi:F-box associated domain containing protein, partial [Tanacetum coccineum]